LIGSSSLAARAFGAFSSRQIAEEARALIKASPTIIEMQARKAQHFFDAKQVETERAERRLEEGSSPSTSHDRKDLSSRSRRQNPRLRFIEPRGASP